MSLWMKSSSVTIQTKATEHYFPVVLLFITLYKVILTFESVDEIYLNNRVLLSKALSCDRLLEEILSENCQKRALCSDRRPLRRDTNASRDRFRPMGTRLNLVLYYNEQYFPKQYLLPSKYCSILLSNTFLCYCLMSCTWCFSLLSM